MFYKTLGQARLLGPSKLNSAFAVASSPAAVAAVGAPAACCYFCSYSNFYIHGSTTTGRSLLTQNPPAISTQPPRRICLPAACIHPGFIAFRLSVEIAFYVFLFPTSFYEISSNTLLFKLFVWNQISLNK